MSTAVTMQDLELETAELLPSRETLTCCELPHSTSFSVTQLNASQIRQHRPVRPAEHLCRCNGNLSGNNVGIL